MKSNLRKLHSEEKEKFSYRTTLILLFAIRFLCIYTAWHGYVYATIAIRYFLKGGIKCNCLVRVWRESGESPTRVRQESSESAARVRRESGESPARVRQESDQSPVRVLSESSESPAIVQ